MSATTGLGLALARLNSSNAQPQASSPQSLPSPRTDESPLSIALNTPMSTPTPSNTPVVDHSVPVTPTPDRTPVDAFPRKPLVLSDAAQPGTDFYRFREQLRQAVKTRDVDFVAKLIPETGVSIGYGRPSSFADLEFTNPDAEIWAIFEKALAVGCDELSAEDYPLADPGTSVWLCANVGNAFLEQYPNPDPTPGIEYEISYAAVVGDRVHVRSLPTTESEVVGTLSNEVVRLDRQIWERTAASLPDEVWTERTHPLNGWTPVLLPNQTSGYVSNRYVYQALAPRLLLGQVNGQWQVLQIPAGD
ncbi:MAG: hypothetical protein IGR76_17320 [Synechococcales cyanobacterium T60_A2020_003]|nr:hypothetical protein [Synechococcales cyanobacterium T60_A2020_003]